ncbi:MAG: GIY-YIG nuclease family protein [Rhizobiaceae bacterium]
MKTIDRKAAVAAYKEKKVPAGVFSFRDRRDGSLWVGSSPNLGQIENRIRSELKLGSHRNAALQRAWDAHGADAFAFETREVIDAETEPYLLSAALKDCLARWQAELGAQRI